MVSFVDFFNGNPLLNFVTLILAIIGVICSIYFYIKSKRHKVPIYMTRTINLIKEKIQKIESVHISYAGGQINNLSITKIAFWNDGRDTINLSDVAKNSPIRVEIIDEYEILDCEILFCKNSSNDFRVILSQDKKYVDIVFDYFDFEEGIVIQLYHTGNNDNDINIVGQVKSVKSILRKDYSISLFPFFLSSKLKRQPKSISKKTLRIIIGWIFIVFGGIGFFSLLYSFIMGYNDFIKSVFKPVPYLDYFVLLFYIWVGYCLIKRRIPKGFDIFSDEF